MVWGQWPTIAAKNVEIQLMIIDLGRPFPSHVQGGNLVTVWLRFSPVHPPVRKLRAGPQAVGLGSASFATR